MDAPSVSMRGDSAVFMAGLQWDPAHSSLHVDLGLEGSAGVRQSIGGQARLGLGILMAGASPAPSCGHT